MSKIGAVCGEIFDKIGCVEAPFSGSAGLCSRWAAMHRRSAVVLDASTRVATAARSGLIDLHFAFVVDHAE
jgi:hypothetical protein